MYDCIGCTTLGANSFFDVYFEVLPNNTDYGVHIVPNGYTLFEKPINIPSTFNPDGSFNFNAAPWSPILPGDPDFAQFHAKFGSGLSQNSSALHLMAEFDVTIKNGGQGLYSPAPAFWSASTNNFGPISSGIFQLKPDGSTTVVPVLGPGGAPILVGTAAPEPSTLWIFGSGALALLALRKRK